LRSPSASNSGPSPSSYQPYSSPDYEKLTKGWEENGVEGADQIQVLDPDVKENEDVGQDRDNLSIGVYEV
jgi:hypothetical protein